MPSQHPLHAAAFTALGLMEGLNLAQCGEKLAAALPTTLLGGTVFWPGAQGWGVGWGEKLAAVPLPGWWFAGWCCAGVMVHWQLGAWVDGTAEGLDG